MKPEVNDGQVQNPVRQSDSAQEVHLLDLLIVLSKRRKLIFCITAGVAILTAVIVLLLPIQYTAKTVVLPPGQSSSMSSILMNQIGGSEGLAALAGASLGLRNPSEMCVSLFRSRTVEDSVIQRFGLTAKYRAKNSTEARTAFEAHSKVALGTKDGLLTISVTDGDPRQAAAIANGYIEEFRKFSAGLAITEASQRRAFFQQQLLEAQGNLTAAEEAMKKTEQATGVFQIDSQTRSLIESAAALHAQIVAKQVQLQGMRAYATENNPAMLEAKQELSALQAQLAGLGGSGQDASSGLIVPKGKLPEASMAYLRKLRDVKYYGTITDLLAKQLEAAKLDEARQGTLIQVVDAAVPPDRKSFPKRTISVIVATLLGFFLACGGCIIAEGFRRLKSNPDEKRRLEALRATFR